MLWLQFNIFRSHEPPRFDLPTGLSQSEEISSDLCCFCGGGISHNEDALFSEVYCCLILNYTTPIEMRLWKLVVRALFTNVEQKSTH